MIPHNPFMRRVFCIAIFLILLLVMATGCLQPGAPQTTPTVTLQQVSVVTSPVVATTVTEKQLVFNVTKSAKAVTIVLEGGDTSDLVALDVLITNQDSSKIKQTITGPVVGFPYIFTYMGLADPTVVNIVGTFEGGYQQTVLMYYFQ